MGAWGIQPEECDRGDDWLINLWRDSDIFSKLDATLDFDYRSNHEEIRVAISLAVSIERFGIIPPSQYDSFWNRAKNSLERIKTHEVYQIDDFQDAIASEIQIIEHLMTHTTSE